MLPLIRGTAVFLRRLVYTAVVLGLFLASAAVGAAYRDAHPTDNWQDRVRETLHTSGQTLASGSSHLFQLVAGLGSDLKQFASDIRSPDSSKDKTARARAALPPLAGASAQGTDGLQSVALKEGAVRPEPTGDPLRFVNTLSDCDAVRSGMTARYGTARFENEIADQILREEFRHVYKATCTDKAGAACNFEWCSPDAPQAAADEQPSGDVSDEDVPAIQEVRLEQDADRATAEATEETAGGDSQTASQKKLRTSGKGEKASSSARIARAKGANILPRTPARESVRQLQAASLSNRAVVAKRLEREPASDSLARTEKPEPALGRLSFPREASDEPDEYNLIVRRGREAKDSLRRSTGDLGR